LAISSFGGNSGGPPGMVRIAKDLDEPIQDEDVLLVEDIVDTGFTTRYLLQTLAGRAPRSIAICTLLDRTVRRIVQVPVDFRCFLPWAPWWERTTILLSWPRACRLRRRSLPIRHGTSSAVEKATPCSSCCAAFPWSRILASARRAPGSGSLADGRWWSQSSFRDSARWRRRWRASRGCHGGSSWRPMPPAARLGRAPVWGSVTFFARNSRKS